MFWIYIWVYTLFLAFIWGLFIVVKIHSLKFQNFQTSITKIIRIISIVLLLLSITWYFIIYSIYNSKNTSEIKINSTNLKNQIIDDTWVNYY